MARKKNIGEDETAGNQWREGDLILQFKLKRITEYQTPLMQEWLDVSKPTLTMVEQSIFDDKYKLAVQKIAGWSEEDLKMKFISYIIDLGYLVDSEGIVTFFDKMISATVEGIKLTVKSDFMMASGVLDVFRTPYFHFQEYKPQKNPAGDSMGQLLQAFLIAQEKNKNTKPLYGVEIIGKQWTFVIMEGKEYCVSKSYDCLDRDDLLLIISILRKFKNTLLIKLME
jgi:hypothetical protein